ncbi:MAG: signal recognition particle protein [Candidatus Thermofonsia Clade 1 bacterium]|uniref:Signal recognition particle protein n=1 Tax=Candidatus Thermofonsia Clade 1 bacterium TaxID=2364210 RepID=A0A2M8NZ64_9CHLR|nr:MAG: signal recognition particle protein [Candidatus Thermofonsia Clade 1 bacterium]
MFESLTNKLQEIFDRLGRRGVLTEADVDVALREVRLALLEADVALPVAKDFIKRVRERAIGAEVLKALKPSQMVIKIVFEELQATLGEPGRLNLSGTPPVVIMLVGLQGSGKTTTAAKLALKLRREGRRPYLVAADTYRPAAVDQLKTLGKQLDVPVYDEGTSAPPPDIAERGLRKAREVGAGVLIVDTAGRLQIDERLMTELEQIKARLKPAEILLVADAMTGQEAVKIAEGFHARIGLTGLILTKMDGDARGGAAISMRAVTGVPIKFVGVGEKPDALDQFYPDRMAQRILGMGDMLSLIEKAQEAFDQREAERLSKKLMRAEFNLEDFLAQMQQVKRLGPISQLMSLIPGMGRLKDQIDEAEADRSMKKIEAIIRSMTPEERRDPKILNASRKRRIARGAGYINTEKHPERELEGIQEINALLRQFREMQKMMKMFKGGRGDISRLLKGQ